MLQQCWKVDPKEQTSQLRLIHTIYMYGSWEKAGFFYQIPGFSAVLEHFSKSDLCLTFDHYSDPPAHDGIECPP